MKRFTLMVTSLLSFNLFAATAVAEEVVVDHEPSALQDKDRVYIQSTTSRQEEHCFYNKEHDHIHCYDEEPTQTVIVEERAPRRVVHRHTRYDPISTGVGVGIAIGLPILVHHALHDRHYRYSNRRYSNNRYSNNRYSNNRYSNYRYSNKHHRKHRWNYGKSYRKHRRNRY